MSVCEVIAVAAREDARGTLPAALHLTAGTRLGVYEIRSLLGAGGMGEVYRARDSKLNREVAIKVLSGAYASDPERLSRWHSLRRRGGRTASGPGPHPGRTAL